MDSSYLRIVGKHDLDLDTQHTLSHQDVSHRLIDVIY